jgi:Terminase small subunit
LTDLNATQAAIRAGYSERTSQQIGTENLSKPVIRDEIERSLKNGSSGTAVEADGEITFGTNNGLWDFPTLATWTSPAL